MKDNYIDKRTKLLKITLEMFRRNIAIQFYTKYLYEIRTQVTLIYFIFLNQYLFYK